MGADPQADCRNALIPADSEILERKKDALKAFQKVKTLGADLDKDPNFRNLDQLLDQASH